MTVVPARPLIILFSLLLVIQSARAEWPRVLVLPPECPPEMSTRTGADFQWHLADVLYKCRYFEVVTRMDYELYCRAQDMRSTAAVPDSLLPEMMNSLGARIVAHTRLSQPGGKLAAEVTFTIPADELSAEGYVISSGRKLESDASRSWNLADDCIDELVDERKTVYRILDARQAYGEAVYNNRLKGSQLDTYRKQALECCEQLVKIEPGSKIFRYMEAMTLLFIYKRDDAERKFRAILAEIDPDHIPTHERLAAYYFDNGELENAHLHYSRLMELEPGNYSHASHLGQVLARMGRGDEAAAIYERLIAISDTDSGIRHWLAEYYEEQAGKLKAGGESEAADSMLAKALKYMARSCELSRAEAVPGDSSWVERYCQRLNFLAMLQREQSGAGSEAETLRRIVELDPSFPGAMYNLGVYEHSAGNFDKALEYYTAALGSEDPAHGAELQYQIGVINLKQFGRYPEAIAALSSALKTEDVVTRELAYYLRGTAYYSVAGSLRNGGQGITLDDSTSAVLSGLTASEQAGWYYDRALEDFQQVSPENTMLAESVQQHISSIEKSRKKLIGVR